MKLYHEERSVLHFAAFGLINSSFIQLTVCYKKMKQLWLLKHYEACFWTI